jgi:hypothetical protein
MPMSTETTETVSSDSTTSDEPKALVRPAVEVVQKPSQLTEEEIRARLTIDSPELVQELYMLAQSQVTAEVGRQTRLDVKANSLLTASGLSLTVAFTFGGLLVNQTKRFDDIAGVVGVFAVSVACGLVAAIYAVRTLTVTGRYRTVDEESVFNPEALRTADEPAATIAGLGDKTDAEKRAYGVMEYRKFLVPHLWSIVLQHREIHEDKAKLVKRGQGFFIAFLGFLLIVCVFVVGAVLSRPQ